MKIHSPSELTVSELYCVHRFASGKGSHGSRLHRTNWALIIRGEGRTVYTADKDILSDAAQMVLIPKGAAYSWKCLESGYFYVAEFNSSDTADGIISLKVPDREAVLSRFRELETLLGRRGPADRPAAFSAFYGLLAYLSAPVKAVSVPDCDSRLQPALTAMAERYAEELTNDALAALCGISTVYFRRLFTEGIGLPPHRYLKQLRIKKAKELLRSDYDSVAGIAAAVGYQNIYDFSRAFRDETGQSPLAYARGMNRGSL